MLRKLAGYALRHGADHVVLTGDGTIGIQAGRYWAICSTPADVRAALQQREARQ